MQVARHDTPTAKPQRVNIASRRYLGNKSRLVGFFAEVVADQIGDPDSLADVMAGTGAVANAFNTPGRPVLANDLLYCNHLSLKCFLGDGRWHPTEVGGLIEALNALQPRPGYAARHFGAAYFSTTTAGRIDAIREQIAAWSQQGIIDDAVEAVLITSLLYAADRLAHTCGHYDAFRRSTIPEEHLRLRLPDVKLSHNRGNRICHQDANTLIGQITADVVYLDPPYNSRQYSDTYHVLENLARWQKPPVFGQARKMDRSDIKSEYCTRSAAKALDHLVQGADCGHLLLSYNNMGNRGDSRSHARISDDDLFEILKRRGTVEVYTRRFNAFSAGLSDHNEGHEERLFHCKMLTPPSWGDSTRITV